LGMRARHPSEPDWMSVSRLYAAAIVAAHDAPFIDERGAMDGYDCEEGSCYSPANDLQRNAHGERRNQARTLVDDLPHDGGHGSMWHGRLL
jgi:hypothetical protein